MIFGEESSSPENVQDHPRTLSGGPWSLPAPIGDAWERFRQFSGNVVCNIFDFVFETVRATSIALRVHSITEPKMAAFVGASEESQPADSHQLLHSNHEKEPILQKRTFWSMAVLFQALKFQFQILFR